MEGTDIFLKDVGCAHKGLHIARRVCGLVLVESMGGSVKEALRL
jgi:ribosomal protein S27E